MKNQFNIDTLTGSDFFPNEVRCFKKDIILKWRSLKEFTEIPEIRDHLDHPELIELYQVTGFFAGTISLHAAYPNQKIYIGDLKRPMESLPFRLHERIGSFQFDLSGDSHEET